MNKELRRYTCHWPKCGHIFEKELQITIGFNQKGNKHGKKNCGKSTITCPKCGNNLPSIEGSELIGETK